MKNFSLLLFCILFSSKIFAGGWGSGGGGGIRKDSNNPWFLYNTKKVTYCILENAGAHSVPMDRVRGFIKAGFQFWKTELLRSSEDDAADGSRTLGQQTFEEVPACTAETDIRFQFAYLTDEQASEAALDGVNLKDFASIAVRTSYDEVNLKGKGLIFFAADKSSSGLFPTTSKFEENYWSRVCDGCVLQQVILHELGHVFGVAHFGAEYQLMGERYPEYAIRNPEYVRFQMFPQVLGRNGKYAKYFSCLGSLNPLFKTLGLNADSPCLLLEMDDEGYPAKLTPYSSEYKPAAPAFDLVGPLTFKMSRDKIVKAWVTPAQTVFTNLPNEGILGPPVKYLDLEASLNRKDGFAQVVVNGKKLTLSFHIEDNCATVLQTLDNEMIQPVVELSPLGQSGVLAQAGGCADRMALGQYTKQRYHP